MLSLVKSGGRRHKRAFESQWTGSETGGRLESRALTAPAFFMRSPGDPARRYEVTAQIGGGTQLLPQSIQTGTTSASNAGQGEQDQFGMPNIVISGLITSDWEDVDNAGGPGTTPVGSEAISGNVSSQLTGNHVGFVPGIPATLGTRGTSSRTYFLADTAPTPVAPITLIETYSVFYAAASGPTFTSTLMATLNTPTAGAITAMGGATGITGVVVGGGFPHAVGTSGIVTGATLPGALPSTIAYNSSATSVNITITTIFPSGVPSTFATTPPNQNPTNGVVFNVANDVIHTLTDTGNGPPGQNPHGATAMSTVTTHYDAHFFA